MPLAINGVFLKNADCTYEVEATYQLKYLISSALIALEHINSPKDFMIDEFPNPVHYYRFYLDHIFYLLGQINDRFIEKWIKDDELREIKHEHILLNRGNYRFTEDEFKIISKKSPRNLIEHLDERNLSIIKDKHIVGGFNVIFPESDRGLIESVNNNRDCYPYILDLIENRVYFYDSQAKGSGASTFDIDLEQLKAELLKLEQRVNDIDQFLQDVF